MTTPSTGSSTNNPSLGSPKDRPLLNRGWSQQIETTATALQIKLQRARDRNPPNGLSRDERDVICAGVGSLIDGARWAARGQLPRHRWWISWWRGTSVEAAFRKSHQAEVELARLYTDAEIDAEVATAVARTDVALSRDDPVRADARRLLSPRRLDADPDARRLLLSRTVQAGYDAVDGAHTRLRNLRNVLWSTTACIALLVSIFVGFVATHPSAVPLCFEPQPADNLVACPTGESLNQQPQSLDVVVVGLLGLLGGALAAAISIRNLRGTSTPYDLPIALAGLKVPVGALTAIGALIAVRGEFVPGLSALDSQEQILAYALVFGYAQQLLTGLIDRKARDVMSLVPGKDVQQNRPECFTAPGSSSPQQPGDKQSGDKQAADKQSGE